MKKNISIMVIIVLIQSIHASELKNNSPLSIEQTQSSKNSLISKNEAWASLKEVGWYEVEKIKDSVTFVNANYIEIESVENSIVKAMVRVIDHPEPLDINAKNYYEYTELRDCKNNTATLLSIQRYKNNKLFFSNGYKDMPAHKINMNSSAGVIQNDICEYLKLAE